MNLKEIAWGKEEPCSHENWHDQTVFRLYIDDSRAPTIERAIGYVINVCLLIDERGALIRFR